MQEVIEKKLSELSVLDIVAFLVRCNVTYFEKLSDGYSIIRNNNMSRIFINEEEENDEKKTTS